MGFVRVDGRLDGTVSDVTADLGSNPAHHEILMRWQLCCINFRIKRIETVQLDNPIKI